VKLSPGPLDGPIEELDEETSTPLKAAPSIAPQPVVAESKLFTPEKARRSSSESRGPVSTMAPPSPTMTRDDILRQRLKKVMGNVGG
jgi:hypothetical protein